MRSSVFLPLQKTRNKLNEKFNMLKKKEDMLS
jgi:hypothetical protein